MEMKYLFVHRKTNVKHLHVHACPTNLVELGKGLAS